MLWASTIFGASSDSGSFPRSSRLIAPFLHWLFPGMSADHVHFAVIIARKCAHLTGIRHLRLPCLERHPSTTLERYPPLELARSDGGALVRGVVCQHRRISPDLRSKPRSLSPRLRHRHVRRGARNTFALGVLPVAPILVNNEPPAYPGGVARCCGHSFGGLTRSPCSAFRRRGHSSKCFHSVACRPTLLTGCADHSHGLDQSRSARHRPFTAGFADDRSVR